MENTAKRNGWGLRNLKLPLLRELCAILNIAEVDRSYSIKLSFYIKTSDTRILQNIRISLKNLLLRFAFLLTKDKREKQNVRVLRNSKLTLLRQFFSDWAISYE